MFEVSSWIRDLDGQRASLIGDDLKDLANICPSVFWDRLDPSFLNRGESALPAEPPGNISAYLFGDRLDSTGFELFLEQTVKVVGRERNCSSRSGAC
jgi:hypothetical protein